MRLPGDVEFNPWCLTDPSIRREFGARLHGQEEIAALWDADPAPARTLAIQAEIDAALARGEIDYMPKSDVGRLSGHWNDCPWGSIYFAKADVTIAGVPIRAGRQFCLVVEHRDGEFHRRLVVGGDPHKL